MSEYQPGDRIRVRRVEIDVTVEATVDKVLPTGTILATYTRIVEEPRDRSVVIYAGGARPPRPSDITRLES